MAELIEWARSEPGLAVDLFDKALSELTERSLVVE